MVTNGQTAISTTGIVVTPIPVALLDPSRLNRHCADSDADIAELAQTIVENGLICPITARPRDGGRYEIICGERRWRAFRLLEREAIPCFIKDLDDTQAQIERIVENYQRLNPSFMEEGEAVAALMKLTDRDVSEVANRLAQSVSWVRRRAKLPNLAPAWREELAKDNTPYYSIRDHVGRLEELAILPTATQETILHSGALRYIKTTKEMRNIIGKMFMNLDAKPWTRVWEKKAFSGSGKKRCDACMKRSDRENALFADPDAHGTGEKMCLDPQCWKSKCLSWCQSQIEDNPGMVPIRQGYSYGTDDLTEYFGVKPVSYYDWQEREDTEAREGYAAVVGVFVDGPEIGTTKNIWLSLPDENDEDEGDNEDSGVSNVHDWRRYNENRHQTRADLINLIAADIAEYLADIDTNATTPAAELAQNKARACFWFGVEGAANYSAARIDDPTWNPLASAWENVIESLARFVAHIVAEDIAQLYNGESDNITDGENAAALAAMFEIPLDMIATRATDALYSATSDSLGDERDAAVAPMEDSPEPAEPVALDMDELIDPDDAMPLDGATYLAALAEAR